MPTEFHSAAHETQYFETTDNRLQTTDYRQNWPETSAEPNLFELCRDDGQFRRSQRTTIEAVNWRTQQMSALKKNI